MASSTPFDLAASEQSRERSVAMGAAALRGKSTRHGLADGFSATTNQLECVRAGLVGLSSLNRARPLLRTKPRP